MLVNCFQNAQQLMLYLIMFDRPECFILVASFFNCQQFSFITKPLFEAYNKCVSTATLKDFLATVSQWTRNTLGLLNLRSGKVFLLLLYVEQFKQLFITLII